MDARTKEAEENITTDADQNIAKGYYADPGNIAQNPFKTTPIGGGNEGLQSKATNVLKFLLKMVAILLLIIIVGVIVLPWVVVLSTRPTIDKVIDEVKSSTLKAITEIKLEAEKAVSIVAKPLTDINSSTTNIIKKANHGVGKTVLDTTDRISEWAKKLM